MRKLLLIAICFNAGMLAAATFDLRQVRNGSAQNPVDPAVWVAGNVGPANSHFIEGQSIPYRLAISGLAPGAHQLVIEWDTKQNGNHAIDYITHYNRLTPHGVFDTHITVEQIDPLAGLAGPWSEPNTFPIPPPSASATPVAGQPLTSFESLPGSERLLTIWNGEIVNAFYVSEDSLMPGSASSRLQIDFTSTSSEVVVAWGGHIGRQFDWGVGQSASSIKGSPYHTRIISLDGFGGNQDTSLQTLNIIPPPPCGLTGPSMIFLNEPGRFEAVAPSLAPGVEYTWSLAGDGAAASIITPTNGTFVMVEALEEGVFTVLLTVQVGPAQSVCEMEVTAISPIPVVNCPEDITVPCAGAEGTPVSFAVDASDYFGSDLPVFCTPPSGSLFFPGATEVVCVATNDLGYVGTCRFTVNVIDDTPPMVTCPADIVTSETEPGSGLGLADYELPSAIDDCGAVSSIECTPTAGSLLPLGETTVECVVTDDSGNTATCAFTIKVVPFIIMATTTADSGPGSFRQAVLDANDSPGPNTIEFNIPGPGPHTIHLLTPLPEIDEDVVIDGTSQPGFVLDPLIEVSGDDVPPPDPTPGLNAGMVLNSTGATIRGLAFTGFETGLIVAGGGSNVVQGNVIGIGSSGAGTVSNLGSGILITSPHNLIGGNEPGQGNFVAGNGGPGIVIRSAMAHHNRIEGNHLGVSPITQEPAGNGGDGIVIESGAAQNTIGGLATGSGNHIAYNEGHGVVLSLTAGTGNGILGNSIHDNEGLGIDLGGDGVNPLDTVITPTSPNLNQPYPYNLSAFRLNRTVGMTGSVRARPHRSVRVEFYLNDTVDPSGYGEGQTLAGTATLTTDAAGLGTFTTPLVTAGGFGQFVTATTTDDESNTSEFSQPALIVGPPEIIEHPASQIADLGDSVTFCVTVIGSEPLTYQWRLNGANLPGANQPCLHVPSVALSDGGTYTVLILNTYGNAVSDPAVLELNLPSLEVADDLADRVPIIDQAGMVTGNNLNASVQPNEPAHAGKPGGSSVWYSWVAPATGIATVTTVGSSFDTLLAVYEGDSIENLIFIGSDEDRGGFFTSALSFNVVKGVAYQVVVDGFGGAEGDFVLNWDLEETNQLLPIIHVQPESGTVPSGSDFTFHVVADAACQDVHHNCRHPDQNHHHQHDEEITLEYQWLFNGVPIPGATADTYTVQNVQEALLGSYSVIVSTDLRSLESASARLQINETGTTFQNVLSFDKFLDAALSPNRLRIGGFLSPPDIDPALGGGSGGALTRGYTGTQVFTTEGSTTEAGETLICDLVGGASEWFPITIEDSGILHLDTQGTGFDTVMTLVKLPVTNSLSMSIVDCNDNATDTVLYSELNVPVQIGEEYLVGLDGVDGASGQFALNVSLIVEARFTFIRQLPDGSAHFQVEGRPDLNLTIESSSNFQDWVPIVTTNAPDGIFDFVDPPSGNTLPRFYRAVLLP